MSQPAPPAAGSKAAGPIGVLIVDDQALVRAGFRMILEIEPDITVAGEAANGAQALELAAQLRPDIVLMDVRMPGMDGIEATRKLNEMGSRSRVVMLSIHDNPFVKQEAARAGVDAFVAKHQPSEALLAAIRDAAAMKEEA
jgi:DNA-binding NarL/FixJ family response regulator